MAFVGLSDLNAQNSLTLVSVIIPVYQVSEYVERCLLSVMNQTYKGIECIIVNDATKDDSIIKCERLIKNYSGPISFTILHHELNRGLSAARNTGTKAATGEYVYYIDSDDEITKDCLEKMMAIALNDPAVELVQGKYLYYRDGKEIIRPMTIQNEHAKTNEEVRNGFYKYKQVEVVAWNKLIKRSVIQENNLSFIEGLLYEDTPWTFYWLKYVKNAYFLSDVTYHYNIRPNSIETSTNRKDKAYSFNKIFHEIIDNLTLGHEKEEFRWFVKRIDSLYIKEYRNDPAFKEVFFLYKGKSQLYGSFLTQVRLKLFAILRNYQYGWVFWSVILRFRSPKQIFKDIKWLYDKIKPSI